MLQEAATRTWFISASYAAVIFCVEKIFDYDDLSDQSYKKPEEMGKIFWDKQLKRGKSVHFSLTLRGRECANVLRSRFLSIYTLLCREQLSL